jgi:hypothetical protein
VTNADGTKSLKSLRTLDVEDQLEMALLQRRSVVLFVDEAQHVLAWRGEEMLRSTLDKLKLLTEKVPITIVLFGTYELNPICWLNGQLARRCEIHHFSRYHLEVKAEKAEFRRVLHGFAEDNSIIDPALLEQKLELLHLGSLGCPGTALEWLQRVACTATERKLQTAPWSLFEEEKVKKTRYDAIKREIDEGEKDFDSDDLELAQYDSVQPKRDTHTKQPAKAKRRGRPKRKPRNDPCPPREPRSSGDADEES